jgi:hypothetical protein
VDELTRFAQRLVEQLGVSGEGVHRPVEIAVLRETVLPYRTHRRALGIETVEDYETVLLRLVAGERGYVKTMPAEAAKRCREELAQANPDLAILDELADATVQITSMAAAQIVGDDIEAPPAPVKVEKPAKKAVAPAVPAKPDPSPAPPPLRPEPAPMESKQATASMTCPHCAHSVPTGRQVVFCPWCGKRLIPFTCSRCNTELDSAWKHCITCGAPVKDPFSFP